MTASVKSKSSRARFRLRIAHSRANQVALVVLGAVLLLVAFGTLIAPHAPDAQVGPPFTSPSSQTLLGTDYLGEDVASRLLAGGRSVLLFSAVATLLAYLIGGVVGLTAGYRGGAVDSVLMRAMDALLAFPPLLFLLLLATGFGNSPWALVVGIAVVHVPSIARIVRTAALEVARGDAVRTILRREILPNIWGTVIADAGPRFTVSVLLVAAVNFLGLGQAPPAADWALMISENRGGITVNPWAVLAPALLIGMLTVSVNVIGDGIARTLGVSQDLKAVGR